MSIKFNALTPNLTVFTKDGKQYKTTGTQDGFNHDGVMCFWFLAGRKRVSVSVSSIDLVRTYEFHGETERAAASREYLRVKEGTIHA